MKLTSIADLQRTDIGGLEQRIQQLYRNYDDFLDNFPDDSHERAAGIHASELAACKRQVVYSLFLVEKKAHVPKEWRKRFEIGKAIHNMIQEHFELMAKGSNGSLVFKKEVKVEDTPLAKELCITSSCDGIFEFFERKELVARVGLEIKSMAPDTFEKLNRPQEKHVDQAHVYAACLDLPYVWYLYWNKGNQNITPSLKPFLIRFDPKIWERLRIRAHECITAADKGQLPDREEDVHCSWCPYAWTCEPKNVRMPRQARKPLLPILRR